MGLVLLPVMEMSADHGQRMVFLHVGRQVVILGLHIGEAVDPADDHGGVLAQAVQDNPQGLFPDLVGVQRDLDGAFRGGKGFMAGQEREALGFLIQQHGAQVAVADTDLALVRDGAGDAEGLQRGADPLGGFRGVLRAFLDGDGGAQFIKACSAVPIHLAASAAFFAPSLMAMAAPSSYAHFTFSKQMGWVLSTMEYASTPLPLVNALTSSKFLNPYLSRTGCS